MQLITNAADLSGALAAFALAHGAALDAALRDKLADAMTDVHVHDQAWRACECLFANRASIADDAAKAAALTLTAQIAAYLAAPNHQFFQYGEGRGAGVFNACARDLGEPAPIGGWPDPSTDPAPDQTWAILAA